MRPMPTLGTAHQTPDDRLQYSSNDYGRCVRTFQHTSLLVDAVDIDSRLAEETKAKLIKAREAIRHQYLHQPADGVQISIVVPVYGGAPCLAECLDSICRQSMLRFRAGEVGLVVVEDGVEPGSPSVFDHNRVKAAVQNVRVAGARVRRIRLGENQGRSIARNVGLSIVDEGVVVFVDGSMVLDEHFLVEHALRHHRLRSNIALLGFKENVDYQDFLGFRDDVVAGRRRPNAMLDLKHRHKLKEDELPDAKPITFNGRTYGVDDIVNYMELTSYLSSLHAGREGGVGRRTLPTFFQTNIVSVRARAVKDVGGFEPQLRLWGLEDSLLGALLVADECKLIPCPSSLAFNLEMRTNKAHDVRFDLEYNRQMYSDWLSKKEMSYFSRDLFENHVRRTASIEMLDQDLDGPAVVVPHTSPSWRPKAVCTTLVGETLRAETKLTEADAMQVATHSNAGQIVLNEVYVKRNLVRGSMLLGEDQLANELASGENRLVVVVGDAGNGKTSLLWSLYGTLKQLGVEVFFLKHTLAVKYLSKQETLLDIIREECDTGAPVILMLDTADLLLNQHQYHNDFLVLLQLAKGRGATVVTTCRPVEAMWLRDNADECLRLLKYDDRTLEKDTIETHAVGKSELERAVRAYMIRCFPNFSNDEMEHQIRSALALVSGKHDIRELICHPLTMRMLFLLYAPNAIPNEVDAVKLYNDYWEFRVMRDVRAGAMSPNVDTAADLESAACWLSLEMLIRRDPVLPEDVALHILRKRRIPPEHLEQLVTRDVLQRDGASRTVEFFHQTLFEYAAARALLKEWRGEGLRVLLDHMCEFPFEGMPCAVAEHALSQAATRLPYGAAKEDVTAALRRLLGGGTIERMTAARVYCRLPDAAKDIDDLVEGVVSDTRAPEDEAVELADRFVALGSSVPDRRIKALVRILGVIWRRAVEMRRHGNCEHVLDELWRLTNRGTDGAREVAAFLVRHAVVETCIEDHGRNNAMDLLFRVVRALALHAPGDAWAHLVKVAASASTEDLRAKALKLTGALLKELEVGNPGTEMERAVDDTRERSAETYRALGDLWFHEWSIAAHPLDLAMKAVEEAATPLALHGRLHGLRTLAMNADAPSIERLFARAHEQRKVNQASWARVVLAGLWSAPGESGDRAASLVAQIVGDPKGPSIIRKVLVHAVREDVSTQVVLDALLADERVQVVERWLDREDLGSCLPHCIQSAVGSKAIVTLRADVKSNVSLTSSVLSALARYQTDREVATLFELGVAADGLEQLVYWPENATTVDKARAMALVHSSALVEMRRHAAHSKKANIRCFGARLWLMLMEFGIAASDERAEIADCVRTLDAGLENDAKARGLLCRVIGTHTQTIFAEAVSALRRMAVADEEAARNGAWEALVSLSRRNSDSDEVARLVGMALEAPTDSARVSEAVTLACAVLPTRRVIADVWLPLIQSRSVGEFGRQALRNLRGTLRIIAQKSLRHATAEQRVRVLLAIPAAAEDLGLLLLGACGTEADRATLDTLYSDARLKPSVRRLRAGILQKRHNDNTPPWRALENLVATVY